MSNELYQNSPRKRRKKISEVEIAIKEANSLYIQNNLDKCITKAREVLSKFPRSDRAYFLLGLVFEEKKDIIKAYNFYMIAAQLMKNNYDLWYKLYTLSDSLRLFSDKLYFLQIIQRYKNSRELVLEKTGLFKLLKNKYKVLECRIELFEFDGVDFEIFEKIRNETKHKSRTSILAILLIRYYKRNIKACGLEFLMNCIRLQYDSGYLIGTKNLIENYIFPHIDFVPNDIRIIYVVCCLANSQSEDTTLFKNRYENTESENTAEYEITYESLSERVFSASTSIFRDLHRDASYTKTLRLDTFEQEMLSDAEQKGKYERYSSLDNFLTDKDFWESFNEQEQIKKLVDILIELKMFQYSIRLIEILLKRSESLQEFCNFKLGEISRLTNDNNMASLYFENVLKINPDNNLAKSKLYDIYSILGNKDMLSYYKTVNSLINYVDDISNKEKERYRFSIEDCLRFREVYSESRRAFEVDDNSYLKIASPLIEDFLKNEFIFISNSKFKKYSTINDRRIENLKTHNVEVYDRKSRVKIEDNARYLSLHGLDTDEWFYLCFEFIISKIKNKNFSEASVLIRRCMSAEIFIKRRDLLIVLFSLGVKHSLYTNDMFLLTYIFKKTIAVFNNYNLSHYFFYLMNFFVDPLSDLSCGKFLRNIRRYHMRSFVSQKIINIEDFTNSSEDESSNDKSLEESRELRPVFEYKVDFLCLLNSYIGRSVFRKTFKVLDEITQPISLNAEILKWIIYALACKSRNNQEKNKIIKKALAGLNNLLKRCDEEQKYVLMYNIGKVYDMVGFVGYAERYYKDAYQTSNKELKRMCQLNLILIYKKSGNLVLLNRYYEDDFEK